MVGVWDTVGALGIPVHGVDKDKYEFHDTELSGSVKFAYHALAIDELLPEAEKALALFQAMSAESFSSKRILPHLREYASVNEEPIRWRSSSDTPAVALNCCRS